MSLPLVAIVGRPNVGKSSLLNCLAGRRIAIVDATPGVTRDRIEVPIALGEGEQARWFRLVDTGGVGIVDSDRLTDHVEQQIQFGIDRADLILFLIDAREGLTPLDNHVANRLRKADKPVILIASKVDTEGLVSEIGELAGLGFGEPMDISAIHHRNIPELLDRIGEHLGETASAAIDEPVMKLAIVGKRNAGKSTFINALAGEERVIVSETPGTTRDSVDVTVQLDGRTFTVIDTAGVRKRRKLDGDIEFYSQHRALRSVRRADVVAMLIDASVPVSQVDKDLAGQIIEHHKPVVLVVNKWDLAQDQATGEEFADYLGEVFPSLRFAPISLTTAVEGVNVRETIALAENLYQQARTRVTTSQLNTAIEEIVQQRGPSHKAGTRRPKIYYASQVDVAPPSIVVFVNDLRSFDTSWQRFLLNQLRERLPFAEVPIRLVFRSSRRGRNDAAGRPGRPTARRRGPQDRRPRGRRDA